MPYVGQIVNYVLDQQYNHPDEIRPAIVVRVWSETTVNLHVFIDGDNDFPYRRLQDGAGLLHAHWRTSVVLDETNQPGTWHPYAVALLESHVDEAKEVEPKRAKVTK